jgi:hypothetical protein
MPARHALTVIVSQTVIQLALNSSASELFTGKMASHEDVTQ